MIAERSKGAAHPPRGRIKQARQLGQRLRQADRLDRLRAQQRLQLVGLARGASISKPVALDCALEADLVDPHLGRQIDAGVDARGGRARSVGAAARRARAPGRHRHPDGARVVPSPGRLARQHLVDDLARGGVEPQELHAHPVRLVGGGGIELPHPGHLPVAGQRHLTAGQLDLELEHLADRAGRSAGEKEPAARHVGGELLDEGLERRVAQPHTNGRSRWRRGRRGLQGGRFRAHEGASVSAVRSHPVNHGTAVKTVSGSVWPRLDVPHVPLLVLTGLVVLTGLLVPHGRADNWNSLRVFSLVAASSSSAGTPRSPATTFSVSTM